MFLTKSTIEIKAINPDKFAEPMARAIVASNMVMQLVLLLLVQIRQATFGRNPSTRTSAVDFNSVLNLVQVF